MTTKTTTDATTTGADQGPNRPAKSPGRALNELKPPLPAPGPSKQPASATEAAGLVVMGFVFKARKSEVPAANRFRKLLKIADRFLALDCKGYIDDQGKPLAPLPKELDPCQSEPSF